MLHSLAKCKKNIGSKTYSFPFSITLYLTNFTECHKHGNWHIILVQVLARGLIYLILSARIWNGKCLVSWRVACNSEG